jgi:hypothetical protein
MNVADQANARGSSAEDFRPGEPAFGVAVRKAAR